MAWSQMNPLLPSRELALLCGTVAVVALSLAWLGTRRLRFLARTGVVLFRLLGIAGLALLAFNPGRWRNPDEDRKPAWGILADRSASMATVDADGHSRWDAAASLAVETARLAAPHGEVFTHPFARELEQRTPADALAKLAPDGAATGLWQAGTALLGQHPAAAGPLAAIFLFSDGIQNASGGLPDFALRARARGAPVYAIALGEAAVRKDFVLRASRPHAVAFPGQPVVIGARLQNDGMPPLRPTVVLTDEAGHELGRTTVSLDTGAEAEANIRIDAGEPGVRILKLTATEFPGETTPLNNAADCVLVTLPGKLRVLTVEGEPFWDSKFLVQRLRQQANVEVTSVYRLANERFFRVSTGSQEAVTSQADAFPVEPGALSRYDVIVLGAGMEHLLDDARVQRLVEFVRDRGGALVCARGRPYLSALPSLAAIEPIEWGARMTGGWRLKPLAAGEDAGLFAGDIPSASASLWAQLPALSGVHEVVRLRPFSRVLAEGQGESGGPPVPLVVSRRYGQGLVVTVNAEGFWQWAFFPTVKEARALHGEFWAQLLQWAATYSEFLPGQDLAMRLDQTILQPGQPLRVTVLQRDIETAASNTSGEPPHAKLDPVVRLRPLRLGADHADAATANATGTARDYALAPGASEGQGETWITLDEPGGYRVEAIDRNAPADSPHPVAQITVLPPPTERDDIAPRKEFLQQLAEQSGGRLIQPSEIAQVIAEREPAAHPPGPANGRWDPAWPRGWLLALITGCFTLEWIIRRRGGIV